MKDIDIAALARRVSDIAHATGHPALSSEILSNSTAELDYEHHRLKVAIKPGVGVNDHLTRIRRIDQRSSINADNAHIIEQADLFVQFDLLLINHEPTSAAPKELGLLAIIASKIAREYDADFVQWLKPDTLLTSTDFAAAVLPKPVQPRRVAAPKHHTERAPRAETAQAVHMRDLRGNHLPRIEETTDDLYTEFSLRQRLQDGEIRAANEGLLRHAFLETEEERAHVSDAIRAPETDPILRLSAWMISIAVAMFSFPVAAALIIYNLFRGEDVRVASQAMALTGLGVTLNATGASAQAIQALSMTI